MQFVDRQIETIIYTDFQDELGELTEVTVPIEQTGFSPYQYRKKVEAYIRANQNHIAIAKLRRNLPLTETNEPAFALRAAIHRFSSRWIGWGVWR
jgi:type I restriction enzyme, R subunit